MASVLEMKDADGTYERLKNAVLAYISECDNPVQDYAYRRILLKNLRFIVGAPKEPDNR